jgi:hypothetical protein
MISAIFILLAAFFNAVMDAVENENFFESIFKNLPKQFWYKRESWKYVKKIFGYRPDAWHLSKTLMLFCFTGAVISFAASVISFSLPLKKWQDVAMYVAAFGVIWNASFWLFYHVIFKVK